MLAEVNCFIHKCKTLQETYWCFLMLSQLTPKHFALLLIILQSMLSVFRLIPYLSDLTDNSDMMVVAVMDYAVFASWFSYCREMKENRWLPERCKNTYTEKEIIVLALTENIYCLIRLKYGKPQTQCFYGHTAASN